MRKQKEGCALRGLAPPRPDPRHPEAVLATVARAAGIDVHKMSLTCTVLVEDASGRVASETGSTAPTARSWICWSGGWPIWTWRGW